ncbi:SpoIIE family protein phosphatase [Streptomyces sp. NPDC056231]|uniref:SpoIIE family protein phosphatase n=1 Tax=Streptomyces sp. NPDC056231 TaxID=3345755 RepID=UPI003AAD7C7F
MTSYGLPPYPPPETAVVPGRVSGGGVPDELSLVLAQAAVSAIESAGGYAGGMFLRSHDPDLLRLSVLAGLPTQLFRPWWRMHVNRPFPVAEAYRSGKPVHLADVDEGMRRFPQLMAGMPFPFGSLYVPVLGGQEKFGVLVVLRPATPGEPVSDADRRELRDIAHRLGAELAGLVAGGTKVVWDSEPVPVQLPSVAVPPVRIGHFDWDLETGTVDADAELCRILGTESARFPGTIDALMALLAPEDVYGLWTLARRAASAGGPLVRRMRLRGPDGRTNLLELSSRWAQPPRSSAAGTLTGFLVDLGAGPVIAEAADRLPHGIFSLDRLGRIMYVNQLAEELLGRQRAELVGSLLWDALPWFGRPAYEDHHRAALLSHEPVHFLARRTERDWLAVSLYPGHDGVTATLSATEQPSFPPGDSVAWGKGLDSPTEFAAGVYRPVALAIALTEAVTARQVSAVVTQELLPAFGGRQLAIYLLRERHLYLAWETGFPHGFLNRFDGVALDAHLPGVEALTSGRPIYFESMQRLASAYPGIPLGSSVGASAFLPLIASGRPVGSCILGFDQPRGFSPEERTVLTALAGLIAHALSRAQRYDTESAVARGLQNALLPQRLPVLDQVDTAGRYLPGTQGMDIGGDWYDVIETGRGLALVIGDVQGHGVAAAATMGQLRSAVRAFALSGHDPQEVMCGTNRLLIDLDPGQIASCCYIVLDPATGRTQLVRAGHPQPLLRHPDGTTEVLELPGGVVLGVTPDTTYPVSSLRLPPGAILALYTDGLVEQVGADIDDGIERLRGIIEAADVPSLAGLADLVIREARREPDRPDDIAVLLAARWVGAWDA